MAMQMTRMPVNKIYMDSRRPELSGNYEFTIDCGAVYFGAVYDDDGSLVSIDQFFYTDDASRDDVEEAVDDEELLLIDNRDFPAKTYLLTKEIQGNEWLRFHAVIPNEINPDYFYQKYIGE